MSIALVERAKAAQTLGNLDLKKYMNRDEMSRVVAAADIAAEGKRHMLLGGEAATGLTLPWDKANGRVRIESGMLAVWCGWSFHGKSQMLKQVMVHAISQGERVCIASMEEKVRDIWIRMAKLATASDTPAVRDIDEFVKFGTDRLWFYDQQGRVKPDIIKAVIRYAAEELKVTQFVVDSLMMLAIAKDDYDGQNRFVGDLHAVAADTGCTIHLVAHLRKSDGRGEEMPGNSHGIAGGHEIASCADYVFNVWRDKKKVSDQPPCILTVEKQRGEIDWIGRLGLGYDDNSRQFTDGHAIKYCGNREAPI